MMQMMLDTICRALEEMVMTSRKKVAFDFVREAMAGSAVDQEALVAGAAVAGSAVAGSAAAGSAAAAALAEARSERTMRTSLRSKIEQPSCDFPRRRRSRSCRP